MHPPLRPEIRFQHPAFGDLYLRVLADVADRRLDEWRRLAAARALKFLLHEQPVERVLADVLTAVHRSLDGPRAVRTLLLGLVGVSAPEKITEWTRAVADRALAEGQLPSFVTVMRILVELRGYDGTVPARWRISLLRAIEHRELASRVLMFVHAYMRRFPAQRWPWIQRARRRSTVALLRRRVTTAEMREARLS